MGFNELLESMCAEVPGTKIATVMSLDGIGVATKQADDNDLDSEVLMIEVVSPLKMAAKALSSAEAGELGTMEMTTPQGTLLVNLLNDEHFVALFLGPDAIVGKGRFSLRRHVIDFNKELL